MEPLVMLRLHSKVIMIYQIFNAFEDIVESKEETNVMILVVKTESSMKNEEWK